MFSGSLRSALVSLALSAVVASATKELSMKVSGPETVDGVDQLKVTATITNTGDETLKLVNDVRTPLSKMATNSFVISNADGAAPSFVGIKAKYSIDKVIEANKDSSFTVLAAGESVQVEHDLSAAYNFTSSGATDYSIEAQPTFTIVDDSNQASEITAKSEKMAAKVSGQLAVARRSLSKRASYNGCSSSEQSGLVSAASAAQSYAASALSYVQSHTSSTTRYTTWFGTYTSSRHSTVQSHYSKISGGSFSSFTYDCTCTESDTYAYVYPDDYGYIYLCGAFWDAPNTGTDSRGGTLIHETSHFTQNGGTEDYVYGQSAAKSLASSNPSEAIMNADNHEYFAENNPSQS